MFLCERMHWGLPISQIIDILRGYISEGEGMLRRLFADARRLAPCLVFVDEFQAVFADEPSQGGGLSSALES